MNSPSHPLLALGTKATPFRAAVDMREVPSRKATESRARDGVSRRDPRTFARWRIRTKQDSREKVPVRRGLPEGCPPSIGNCRYPSAWVQGHPVNEKEKTRSRHESQTSPKSTISSECVARFANPVRLDY